LPTARIKPFSDLLVSMQEWHISPTLFTVETGKHPMGITMIITISMQGNQQRNNDSVILKLVLSFTTKL
jgi:hypothetical protein